MSKEAMKQALEALEDVGVLTTQEWQAVHKNKANELRQAIAEAEKQEQGEPVAWVCYGAVSNDIDFEQDDIDALPVGTMLYTTPYVPEGRQQRTAAEGEDTRRAWIGLTDEEMSEAMNYWSDASRSAYGGAFAADGEYVDMVSTWRYIEAKLKAKNFA